jgi:hypothetical protein
MKYVVVLRLNAAEKFLRSLIPDSFLFSAPTESFLFRSGGKSFSLVDSCLFGHGVEYQYVIGEAMNR